MTDNPFATSGSRIQYLRHLLNQSRNSFAQKYSLSPSTLRQWESNREPITPDRASIILSEALKADLNINIDWVKTGEGSSPTLKETKQVDFYDLSVAYDDAFRFIDKYNSERCEIITISNNEWSPWVSSGDIVIATPIDIKSMCNRLCIVTSKDGIRYIGFVTDFNDGILSLKLGNNKVEKLHEPLDMMKVLQIRYLS